MPCLGGKMAPVAVPHDWDTGEGSWSWLLRDATSQVKILHSHWLIDMHKMAYNNPQYIIYKGL